MTNKISRLGTMNVKVSFLFVAVLSLLCWAATPFGNPSFIWVSLMIGMTIACFIIWLYASRYERRGNWFHPVILFTVSYLIVFYQVPWCIAAGLDTGVLGDLFRSTNFDLTMINANATMAFMGYAFFCFGYVVCILYGDVNKTGVDKTDRRKTVRYSVDGLGRVEDTLLVLCWIALFVFVSLAGSAIIRNFTYSAGLDWGAAASYAFVVHGILDGMLLSLAGLRVILRRPATFKQYCSLYDRRVLVYYIVASVPFILAGDRGPMVMASCFLLGPYFFFVKPLRKEVFATGLVLASILMVFLGSMRTRDMNESWTSRISRGREALQVLAWTPDQWPTMQNLALSYQVLNAAVDMVPRAYPYGLGTFNLNSFTSVIPFYSWIVPEANDYYGNAPFFLTYVLHQGEMSVGVGSACLATIYLDFGVAGIPFLMAILGFCASQLMQKMHRLDSNIIFWHSIIYYAMYWGLRIPRSDPFFWVQTFAWTATFFFFFVKPLLLKNGAMSLSDNSGFVRFADYPPTGMNKGRVEDPSRLKTLKFTSGGS